MKKLIYEEKIMNILDKMHLIFGILWVVIEAIIAVFIYKIYKLMKDSLAKKRKRKK